MNLNQLLAALDNAHMATEDPLSRRLLAEEATSLRAHAQRAEQKRQLEQQLDALGDDRSNQGNVTREDLQRQLREYENVDLSARISQAEQLLREYTT